MSAAAVEARYTEQQQRMIELQKGTVFLKYGAGEPHDRFVCLRPVLAIASTNNSYKLLLQAAKVGSRPRVRLTWAESADTLPADTGDRMLPLAEIKAIKRGITKGNAISRLFGSGRDETNPNLEINIKAPGARSLKICAKDLMTADIWRRFLEIFVEDLAQLDHAV
jgi:hypothetical protein